MKAQKIRRLEEVGRSGWEKRQVMRLIRLKRPQPDHHQSRRVSVKRARMVGKTLGCLHKEREKKGSSLKNYGKDGRSRKAKSTWRRAQETTATP
jgi:hypothetical protein